MNEIGWGRVVVDGGWWLGIGQAVVVEEEEEATMVVEGKKIKK
jgi:hypothetical protein